MEQSILLATKKKLGIGDDDTSFDLDIVDHINSALSVLHDLGVGPAEGFALDEDDPEESEWSEFVDDTIMQNKVKTCVYLRVRLAFDPPATQFALASAQELLKEIEWRLNVDREGQAWTDATEEVLVVDGGSPGDGGDDDA